jgi:hypothetical protein
MACRPDVGFGPFADPCGAANGTGLFDHLVGAQQERLGDRKPKRLGGCQVDNEIELGRSFDSEFAGLLAAQDASRAVRRCHTISLTGHSRP